MRDMKMVSDVPAGVFFSLGGSSGWLLVKKELSAGQKIRVDKQLPVRSMFNVHTIRLNDAAIGFLLTSAFEVQNKGGYLITHLKGKPPADEYDTLIKDDLLVLYDFPNRGSLAVSPSVSDDVKVIFEEQ